MTGRCSLLPWTTSWANECSNPGPVASESRVKVETHWRVLLVHCTWCCRAASSLVPAPRITTPSHSSRLSSNGSQCLELEPEVKVAADGLTQAWVLASRTPHWSQSSWTSCLKRWRKWLTWSLCNDSIHNSCKSATCYLIEKNHYDFSNWHFQKQAKTANYVVVTTLSNMYERLFRSLSNSESRPKNIFCQVSAVIVRKRSQPERGLV